MSDLEASATVLCAWCKLNPVDGRQRYCGRKCRQAAFRLRKRRELVASSGPGLAPGARFAYADPPYPGLAHYYADQPTYAGEVDHAALIASLSAGSYAGWALSTSSKSLRDVLPLCPPGVRVLAWTKPIGVPPATFGLHSTWEPLIVYGGRKCQPGIRDWLCAMPARLGGSDLIGRKPIAFCAFLFDALGMIPGDELDDLFPGSGIVGRAWGELSSRTSLATVGASSTAGNQRRTPLLSSLEERRPSRAAAVDAGPDDVRRSG